MTTSDRPTDLNRPPDAAGYQEQGRTGTDPHVDGPVDAGTSPGGTTGDTATDTRASHAGGAAPSSRRDEPDKSAHEPLISQQRSVAYSSRWDQVKGSFVDEPRQAVVAADQLVSELLQELQELFGSQRREIEQSLDADETSTEDLRVALRRYRSFFERLLSL